MARRAAAERMDAVLDALRAMDPDAAVIGAPECWASQELVKALWAALPEESDAHAFPSVEEQTRQGEAMIPGDPEDAVILHLGYGDFCVRTTRGAAWHTWPAFCHAGSEVYNVCIYPESLGWFVIRAGPNLYPMDCSGRTPTLIRVGERKASHGASRAE